MNTQENERYDSIVLDEWIAFFGWETLLNRRGTTWRRLPPEEKEAIDSCTARGLMLRQHSIIRRPIIEYADTRLIGFDPVAYARVLRSLPR